MASKSACDAIVPALSFSRLEPVISTTGPDCGLGTTRVRRWGVRGVRGVSWPGSSVAFGGVSGRPDADGGGVREAPGFDGNSRTRFRGGGVRLAFVDGVSGSE